MIISIISGILLLGILVFVHELGHFSIAKLCGVKVLKFSLGFGPRLVSHRWGETEYMICAIPLGGFVQMLGEGGGELGESAELLPEEEARSFARQSVWRRTAIIAAGPIMNLLLPFLVLPLSYLIGVQLPAYLAEPPCVGYVVSDSAASRSGFQPGDCITGFNGQPVSSWEEVNRLLISGIGDRLTFNVERNGEQLQIPVEADEGNPEGLQVMGMLPDQSSRIGSVSQGMPALKAGMEPGDRIVAVNQSPIRSWYDLRPAIQEQPGAELQVSVERAGETLVFSLTPVQLEDDGDFLIGIMPEQATVLTSYGVVESFKAGSERAMQLIELTLIFIQKLFAGHISTDSIGGPIQVVQIAGQAAQSNISSILGVLAFLSIQLGILNLLPIPILDGGHLFFNFFEMLRGEPLSLRARETLQQVGLILLLMLMVLAFYNDIMRLFFGAPG